MSGCYTCYKIKMNCIVLCNHCSKLDWNLKNCTRLVLHWRVDIIFAATDVTPWVGSGVWGATTEVRPVGLGTKGATSGVG